MTNDVFIVHAFKSYDLQNDAWVYSKLKATTNAISRFHAVAAQGTAEEVNVSQLDELERYKPPQRG